MRRFLVLLALALVWAAPAGAGTTFVIDGRGWGHGIGMSQYGARGYAQAGWGHARILAHYYPGTRLQVVPARDVRVLVADGRHRVRISAPKPFRVVDARGKRRTLRTAKTISAAGALLKGLKGPLRFEAGAAPLRLDGTAYRGALIVHRTGAGLAVVNRLPLDRYLRGVVPWEMPDDWHPEALKAQAVVARSYALATLKPGKTFDLYADTRSQVYGGIAAESPTTNRALGATAGKVLTWEGRVATTFYHSTSGGRTAGVTEVWPKARAVPYLVSVPDPFDRLSKHHRWPSVVLSPAQLSARLKTRGIRDLVIERGPSGRAVEVDVSARGGRTRIAAQDFRETLGLRSTWFAVRVLNLNASRMTVRKGKAVDLSGFVRGLTPVRLEQQVAGGAWTKVRRLRLAVDGRFTLVVEPRRTTSYRLRTPEASGAAVTVVAR